MFLVKVNDIYNKRLSRNLVYSHGRGDDGVFKISEDYIQNLRYGEYDNYICDTLEENIGRFIADYERYPTISIIELKSIIFDEISNVCKYYMRTPGEYDDEYLIYKKCGQ